ncbi:unnamed protein product [Diatraea saccharalis]|uniref:FP protein C-terminal domain-containing protein n=1 Tax=Diatraea saccharalis TaxID=40085 RepID=A0A9P0G176_9NEOP|nr:unnamed protein product [Diatraea saccharalis]
MEICNMSQTISCAGCLQSIVDRRFLRCNICEQYYDLLCANVSEQRFFNTLTREHRSRWKCPLCINKEPKCDNSNTPVRPVADVVTIRRGAGVSVSPPDDNMDVSDIIVADDLNNAAHNISLDTSLTKTLIDELRQFRKELSMTRMKVEELNETMSRFEDRIVACEERINGISSRIETLEKRLEDKHSSSDAESSLLTTVEQLKMELNERDQDLLLNDIEISCIPETKGESLQHVVMTVTRKLGVGLEEQEIVSVARVGRPTAQEDQKTVRPRPIVVKFTRRVIRDQVLRAARVRRGATTEGIIPVVPPRRFYVNERLTRVNRQVFRRAREVAGRLNWRYVWTRDGRVYARQRQGGDSPRHRLLTEADICRVFESDTVRSSSQYIIVSISC